MKLTVLEHARIDVLDKKHGYNFAKCMMIIVRSKKGICVYTEIDNIINGQYEEYHNKKVKSYNIKSADVDRIEIEYHI